MASQFTQVAQEVLLVWVSWFVLFQSSLPSLSCDPGVSAELLSVLGSDLQGPAARFLPGPVQMAQLWLDNVSTAACVPMGLPEDFCGLVWGG